MSFYQLSLLLWAFINYQYCYVLLSAISIVMSFYQLSVLLWAFINYQYCYELLATYFYATLITSWIPLLFVWIKSLQQIHDRWFKNLKNNALSKLTSFFTQCSASQLYRDRLPLLDEENLILWESGWSL